MQNTSSDHLTRHLRVLTQDIGVRLAGTPGERAAIDYVAAEFARSGAQVTVERFPVRARAVTALKLELRLGDRWVEFPGSLFSSTPGTDGRTLEGPLVFFEAPAEMQRTDLSHLRGKAVVHLGCHIESRATYRRLIEAAPAFMLFVDVRYPGTTPLADGMFPAYTKAIGAVPTVNVAFMDAWRWLVEGATAARLSVTGGMVPGESGNVIADLPGTEGSDEVLYVGGHLDTQADSPGADDDGTGTVGVLELARVLAPLPRRRTVRLIAFGAEEQLSVGSAEYVRRHRADVAAHGRFMFNLDSYGSRMGWTELNVNGPPRLAPALQRAFVTRDLYVKLGGEVCPYTDQFPFAVAGVPGCWLYRPNCAGGRFYHHRPDDDLSKVSTPLMARLLDVVAGLTADWAARKALPWRGGLPAKQAAAAQRFWADLYGGW